MTETCRIATCPDPVRGPGLKTCFRHRWAPDNASVGPEQRQKIKDRKASQVRCSVEDCHRKAFGDAAECSRHIDRSTFKVTQVATIYQPDERESVHHVTQHRGVSR